MVHTKVLLVESAFTFNTLNTLKLNMWLREMKTGFDLPVFWMYLYL